jgi:simple sugar transport system substrate-binding protein
MIQPREKFEKHSGAYNKTMNKARKFAARRLGRLGRWFGSKLTLAVTLALALGLIPEGAHRGKAVAGPPLTIGFVYVGPKTDYGYNQAHAEGAAAIAKLPGVKIREEEMVPETSAVQKTMESMINLDGATLLFPTSFGYFDPHILKEANKYKNVTFLHCGGLYQEGKHPTNVGSYFGYIDEAEYVSGIVAGLTTKSNKLGFIAAKPIPQVLRNINSYTLGARSANPKVTTTVIFTGDWSMPVKEAEAANSLIDQGVDVLTMHVDSPKVIVETAERRGVFVTGYHANQAALAPKGYLTGAEWNWAKVYTDYVTMVQAGKAYPHLLRGGLKEGFVKVSPYGKAVSAAAKKKADAAKAKFMAGTMVVYKGPLKDNTGKVVIPAGTEEKQTDIALEKMDYLVDGVVGKTH